MSTTERAGEGRPIRSAAILAALLCGAPALAAPLEVERRRIERSAELYDVAVAYPATGHPAIDAALAGWAEDQVEAFVALASEPFDLKYSLDVGFEVARNDAEMFAVAFEKSDYLGGAHPNFSIHTFNFTLPDGWRVFLPEIFAPAALRTISALSIAGLKRRLSGPDAMTDSGWIAEGAAPLWENFSEFLLLPRTLVVRFPPYQVAAYAAGPQRVEIPLAELSGLVREDWRTPVPSFDCARARTAPEQAICADVALARLDRALASAYRTSLDFAAEDAAGAVKSAQRAWLSERNACGGDAGCLAAAYEARLAALEIR